MKVCCHCKKKKPLKEFPKRWANQEKRHSWCISCGRLASRKYRDTHREQLIKQNAEWRKAHPKYQPPCYKKAGGPKYYRREYYWNNREAAMHRSRKFEYGITKEEFEKMLKDSKGLCAICETPFTNSKSRCIDHDHTANKVRGLLCRSCNMMLGFAQDSIEVLQSGIEYLMKYAKTN